MPTKQFEYTEVERVSLEELNVYGRAGWYPASMRYEEKAPRMYAMNAPEGWTGLLVREIAPPEDPCPTT